jgi:predicted signal transduction protein with EAL and GGDEF domain
VAARLGGDEFLVVVDDVQLVSDVTALADGLRALLEEPFEIRGMEIFSSASIGVALAEHGSGHGAEALVQDADTAMYQVKTTGGGGVAVFDTAMRDDRTQRLLLEQDLHRVLDRGELRLHYQPIVSLGTERIVGFEALLRWVHPTRGVIPPAVFIPIAEESGLIVGIGNWVLREACRQLSAWQVALPGGGQLTMAVNLSVRQLRDPDLQARWRMPSTNTACRTGHCAWS